MRDLERLHDLTEYRFNASQIRLLCLGVLAVICTIFAVGVSVGKRLPQNNAVAATDPLAELDRAAPNTSKTLTTAETATSPPNLTYHNELTGTGAIKQNPTSKGPTSQIPTSQEPLAQISKRPIRNEPPQPEEPSPGKRAVYALQVASFETREEAEDFAADLRSRGHQVYLVRTKMPERGTWYRVRVGPMYSRRKALTYRSRFERDERLPTFLVKRVP